MSFSTSLFRQYFQILIAIENEKVVERHSAFLLCLKKFVLKIESCVFTTHCFINRVSGKTGRPTKKIVNFDTLQLELCYHERDGRIRT